MFEPGGSTQTAQPTPPDARAWPSGDGELARLIREFDWAGTSLGPSAEWPQCLRTATDLVLQSRVPMVMLWGSDGVMIYNDGYAGFAGGRHPSLLGMRVREAWTEVADFNDNVVRVGLAGGSLAYRDQQLTLNRTGKPAHAWMNLDYSPILDEAGKPAGVLAIVIETTARVRAERALLAERDRSRGVLDGMTEGFMLFDREYRIVDVNAEALRMDTRARDQVLGRACWEVFPGSYDEPVGHVYRRSMTERVPGELEYLQRWPAGHERWLELRTYPVPQGVAVFFRDITARKASEGALRASEARLTVSEESSRLATEAAGVGIWDLDLTTDTLTWSERTRAMFGFAADAPCTMADFYQGLHPADRAATSAAFAAAVDPAQRATYDVQYRTIGKEDGVLRWVAAKGRGLFDEHGRCIRAIGTALDITRNRQTETRRLALSELNDRLRDAGDVAALAFAAVETLGRVLGVTRAGYASIDVARATIHVEQDWAAPGLKTLSGTLRDDEYAADLDALLGADTLAVADTLTDARTAGRADVLRSLDARAMVIEPVRERGELVALLFAGDRHLRHWSGDELAFIREIAERTRVAIERRRAEQHLREREAALRELNESLERQIDTRTAERDRVWRNSRDLLLVLGSDGVFRAINPAWAAILGHSPQQVIGHSYVEFIWPADLARTRKALQAARADELLSNFENRLTHVDGTPRWISWRTTIEGDLLYAYGRDVTAEKAQADALAQAEATLRQAQKMEAVGQLTGGIAHDFNNMLAVVIGSLDLLRRRVSTSETRILRHVEAAADGARRAAQLTQRLLAFSRQQPLKPEPLDINALIAGMSDLLRHSLGPDVRLETVVEGGLWRAHADPNQLENVILNLSVNARDAMPDGGRLRIDTHNVSFGRNGRHEPGLAPGDYVQITVADTGTGMSEEVIAKAFDPFFTTKEVGKGTGLGLSQVYGFVKQSGGHVKIQSKLGHGTAIRMYLPRLVDVPGKADDEIDQSELQRGDERDLILVVEDETAVRQYSVEALTELGYRVLEADGAAAALALLDANPDVTLLFTDLVMPEVNGRRLADQARQRRPALKILFTTGYPRESVADRDTGELDGTPVLGKPFTIAELASKIRRALD